MNERLKEIRLALHLNQSDLGAAIGISGAAVSKIEKGENRLTEANIKLLCSIFHVNFLWITQGVGPMFEGDDLDSLIDQSFPELSVFQRSIYKAFARLPDSEWDKLKDLIDKIKKEGL